MTPEDLKNSNEELKATPEENGAADAPELIPENTLKSKEVENSEVKEENETSAKEETVPTEKEPDSEVEQPISGEEAQEEVKAELKNEPVVENQDEKEKDEENIESSGEASAKVETEKSVDAGSVEEKPVREMIDYTALGEVELINALRDLLENHANEDIKADIDSIKINFYKKHRAIADAEKKVFLEEGGNEEDFEASNTPYEEDLRNLLKDFRQLRNKQHRQLEDEKEENLQRKYEIIDEIKNLVNRKESINKTFQEFRDLQQEWREIGLVPQSKLKDLWETYHHHVENFYDYIKINRELRDLDLKKNLEAKIILCEKAEELLVEPSIIKAFNILQKYHEQWREIGPVPRDKKEELWERFKAATAQINKKHQGYFEGRKQEQKKNLEAKTVLCEKAEEIANHQIQNHREWDKKSRELIELQKVWRTIGFAPKKDNNRIYERFRSACDQFFDAKREFYAQNKELQMNNLQMKTDLCVQAEALKDSTDWRKTTDEFIRIQKKWKEIGPVPRKHSDVIWKRFRAACDFFFDNKSNHFHHVDEEQVDNLQLKKDLIEEVKNYKLTKVEAIDLANIKEFQRRWTDIGHVPFKEKDVVQNEFRDAINKHFDSLKIDDQQRDLLKFKTKMSNISGTTRGNNKMRYERDKYVNKLKQLENDLTLLNNNIGFFANTKNAESLIDDVNRKIQDTEEKIEFLKEKINIIDSMDDED
ncbi:DUF349 domain-containing protein [uncultured Sunxiuqinia sp.]|uniref:DUF349 domain-containing protein n=1 Tax=uncultured Sunxiuqinia sp. TaxID=1573825 RepID=UPI0026031FE2|nr:DUF349 domain-containing protein [uncultured Sunxiuqinia sp.]